MPGGTLHSRTLVHEADDRGTGAPGTSVVIYYYGLKVMFFCAIVRALVRFEPIKDHWLFLGVLYTAAVAFLSAIFISNWEWPAWQLRLASTLGVPRDMLWRQWVAQTFGLSTLYFWLLARFDEGVVFWTLLMLGALVVLF